jgi:hypothetical protein
MSCAHSHRKVENFRYAEDKKETQSFGMDFRVSEIRIEMKKISISENDSETICLSIVFGGAETQSENLYFSSPETNNETY